MFIKHLRENPKEYFDTKLQQNLRTLNILKIMVGFRTNSV